MLSNSLKLQCEEISLIGGEHSGSIGIDDQGKKIWDGSYTDANLTTPIAWRLDNALFQVNATIGQLADVAKSTFGSDVETYDQVKEFYVLCLEKFEYLYHKAYQENLLLEARPKPIGLSETFQRSATAHPDKTKKYIDRIVDYMVENTKYFAKNAIFPDVDITKHTPSLLEVIRKTKEPSLYSPMELLAQLKRWRIARALKR